MANIFRATQTHAGGFRASDLVMRIGANTLAGHVVQQISLQYQQQITTLYEVGSSNVYYVGGRAQGNLTIARVAGPEAVPGIVIDSYNDICNPGTLELSAGNAQCRPGGSFVNNTTGQYILKGVLIMSMGISTQAQDVVVNEQMAFQFIDLEMPGVGG
jgi:hypothetical protein